MGDRAQVVIEQAYSLEKPGRVYLYAHWSGTGVLSSALHGLNSGRADDAPYLARIVFEHMIREDKDEETGFGISSTPLDWEYPNIVISVQREGTFVYFETGNGKMPLTAPMAVGDFRALASGYEIEKLSGYELLIDRMKKAEAEK